MIARDCVLDQQERVLNASQTIIEFVSDVARDLSRDRKFVARAIEQAVARRGEFGERFAAAGDFRLELRHASEQRRDLRRMRGGCKGHERSLDSRRGFVPQSPA